MKNKKILYLLMILPFILTGIALLYLPQSIPAHYGFNNEVTRWGSKFETLIMPFVGLGIGFLIIKFSKLAGRKEKDGNNNENATLYLGIILMVVMNVLSLFMIYTSFKQVENLNSLEYDFTQILFFIFGVFMIVIGNIMPKIRMNSFLGIRNKWSMSNETVWKSSQKVGGIIFILYGFSLMLISYLLKGRMLFLMALTASILLIISSIYSSYFVYRKSL